MKCVSDKTGLVVYHLDDWIHGFGCNSAVVVLVPCHHQVPAHTPIYAPTIFDQPVVFILVCSTITHSQNCVIQMCATATCVIVHTTAVEMELPRGSVDADRYGPNCCYCLLKRVFITRSKNSVIFDSGCNWFSVFGAEVRESSSSRYVRVISL